MTGLPWWFIERQQLRAAENFLRLGLNNRFGSALIGCGGQGRVDATNVSSV
jgi:hypothetical protein